VNKGNLYVKKYFKAVLNFFGVKREVCNVEGKAIIDLNIKVFTGKYKYSTNFTL